MEPLVKENTFHKDLTAKNIVTVYEAIGPRNVSLAAELAKYRKEGRRVFVIAGARHLLEHRKLPGTHHSNCQIVKDVHHWNEFILLPRKNVYAKIARYNKDLKQAKLSGA